MQPPPLQSRLITALGILLGVELNRPRYVRIIQRVLSLAAIFAGARVLAGSDPGYTVFRPLLIYNTAMGIAYVAAGIIAWRSLDRGKYTAATIFVLNLLVLGAIGYLYTAGSAVAVESLRAMAFRTVVWLLLFLGLAWMSHRNYGPDSKRGAQPPSPPDSPQADCR
jgi:preprotein translocase subunit SecG